MALFLAEGEVIKGQNVMKWEYTPEDAVKELEKEGNTSKLKKEPEEEKKEEWRKTDVAASNPMPFMGTMENLEVKDLFDEVPNHVVDEPSTLCIILRRNIIPSTTLRKGSSFS